MTQRAERARSDLSPFDRRRAGSQSSALVFLVGLSGSGKSSVGRLLAERLGVPFVDTDAEIERRCGASVSEIFESKGEPAFRALEHAVVAEMCSLQRGVVATGGGVPVHGGNRQAMRRAGAVIWLDAPTDVLLERLRPQDGAERPLLRGDPAGALQRLRAERQSAYAEAGFRLDTAGRTPEEVAAEIMSRLNVTATFEPIWVRTPSQTYPVYVGPGVLSHVGELLRTHGIEGHLRVIADERVVALHGEAALEALGDRASTWYRVPAGEEHKTLDQAARLYDAILADRPERRDVIVALGGGVMGDLAGFVAATLLRGLRLIQIPTTLLSQVDSSVGGKVGVDHPRGKNLIGAFLQPIIVIADVDLLRTLSPRDIAAGWAEVVKIAVIQDAALFDELERSADSLRNLEATMTSRAIRRAIELKARVVEQDERDSTGVRAILNYGHTLGHALEAATEYAALLHGEAVAIGMAGAAHIAYRLGYHPREAVVRQQRLLERLELPQRWEGVNSADLRAALGLDKKRLEGRVTWVLPTGLGSVRTSAEVPKALVDEAIDLISGRASS